MKFKQYLNDKGDVERFRENTLIKFKNDISKYNIPDNLRVIRNVELYPIALKELDDYFKGKITTDEIFHNPDNTLRQIIKLWPIDKKKLKKK